MPRLPINYQNTVIYKICCDDINDFYIGSTTDFTKRKNYHKSACNNEGSKAHNLKVYQTIRANGGWDNWRMVEIERYPCNNRQEAHMREEQIRMALNATLNIYRAWADGGKCEVEGCANYPQRNRLCIRHGAVVKRCSIDGCENYPQNKGICIKHGAVLKRCSIDGCNNYSQNKGVCVTHGAVLKRCSIDGCDNMSKKGGVCVVHSPKYNCEVCNKTVAIFYKSRHEKGKKHMKNLN